MEGEALRIGPTELCAGVPGGPLDGLRFVVKDNFDVEGHRTGCGQPAWLAEAAPALRTAPVVEWLVQAGASLVGKAHQDELAFSLSGTNVHYGAPTNPAAPHRESGGSSSGSASAVASGTVEFALGTDTGGSVRVPASCCGILGLRSTHGRIPVEGIVPLAPCFDTVGWFARHGAVLEQVGRVLLDEWHTPAPVRRILVAKDAVGFLDRDCLAAFDQAVDLVARMLGAELSSVEVTADDVEPAAWLAAFRILQGREAWAAFGEWITTCRPSFGPGVAARFEYAAALTPIQVEAASEVRAAVQARVESLVGEDKLLVLPSASGPALPLALDREAKDERRGRTLRLTSIASLAGTPAISLPLCSPGGLPLGLSLLGARGADEGLLGIARMLLP